VEFFWRGAAWPVINIDNTGKQIRRPGKLPEINSPARQAEEGRARPFRIGAAAEASGASGV